MVKTLYIVLCTCLLASGQLLGQSAMPSVATGHSGQFKAQFVRPKATFVHAEKDPIRVSMGAGWAFLILPGAPPRSAEAAQELEPALLVASCERMKNELLFQLGLPDQWAGKVDLNINSALPEDAEPLLTAVCAPRGWRYELELPASIKAENLARALTHVLLLEMANRNAAQESARIPFWLVEGMMGQIQSSTAPTLFLQANLSTVGDREVLPPVEQMRARFRARAPLTFQELSWPPEEQLTNKDEVFYRTSAHLLVYELLRFKDGRACLGRFLGLLPRHLNWQVAFLEACQPHFASLRDAEKWWGLTCLNVTGHNLADRWNEQESGEKLQEALNISVRVHTSADDLPTASSIPVQEVILRWAPSMQTVTLQKALATLTSMQARIAPEFAPILDGYCQVLNTYLHTHSPRLLSWAMADNTSPRFQQATCKQLAALDQQLAGLRVKVAALAPAPEEAPAVQISTRQAPAIDTAH